jgi:hypothetical protein
MSHRTIGICSLCGGAVRVPIVWAGVFAPRGECADCRALVSHGVVIPMMERPANKTDIDAKALEPPKDLTGG